MGLQQFERRLERLVEGVFARAFRSGLQPVEVGRRLAREMDLRRTMAPRGTLTPNQFTVMLAPEDYDRFAPIEDELVAELVSVARDHARAENYVFIGPVSLTMEVDDGLAPGTMVVSGEMVKAGSGKEPAPKASLVLPDGRRLVLGDRPLVIGRLPDSGLVLADPNVSRHHAEVRPIDVDGFGGGSDGSYAVADLASTNGTKVNGIPVTGPQLLRDGDRITVGASEIRFERP